MYAVDPDQPKPGRPLPDPCRSCGMSPTLCRGMLWLRDQRCCPACTHDRGADAAA